ncbi:MAG: hypothetical protein AAB877_02040 [Patescibacteria group bacterium]
MFSVRGNLPEIIRNDEGLYEGDLKFYFKTIFDHAQNHQNGYHNFRHTFHIVWLVYQACRYYKAVLSPRQMRILLIAAMWHDFDHPGILGNDDLNIERAIRGFKKHVPMIDLDCTERIFEIIASTEFPYKTDTRTQPLPEQIIRDADMGQSFAMAWLQQVVFGLAEEWGRSPIEILKSQPAFLRSVRFFTDWGKEMFPQEQISAKIKESEELLELLA